MVWLSPLVAAVLVWIQKETVVIRSIFVIRSA